MDINTSSLVATGTEEEDGGLIDEETDPAGEQLDQVGEYVPEEFEAMVTEAGLLWGVLIGVGVAFLFALVLTMVTSTILKQFVRKAPEVRRAIDRTRMPLLFTLTALGAHLTVGYVARNEPWHVAVSFVLLVVVVVGVAWWALRLVRVAEAFVLAKYIGESGGDVEDRRGRRLQTQVSLIRRILAAVIITLAVAAVLLSIEEVRALGVGMLASAGVVSVVAGLAMQSTLTNVFAGIQLAFTDSIRVGDVVVVEDKFGTVEDITLSAVVLKCWDGRRFIYPSSYFVGTPFENWTRVGTELMGTIEFEVDWRVPMDALRGRLSRLVEATDLWDGQEASIQVTEALGGTVKARAVVSARNSGELWDLQCLVREDLVHFLRAEYPYAVAAQRMLISTDQGLVEMSERGDEKPAAPAGAPAEHGATEHAVTENAATEQDGSGTGEASHGGKGKAAGGDGGEEHEFLERYGSVTEEYPAGTGETPLTTTDQYSSIFTGSISAVERNREFAGPGEDAYRERREDLDGDPEEDTQNEPRH